MDLIPHRGTQSRAPSAQRRHPASHGECQDQLGQGRGLPDLSELAPQPVPRAFSACLTPSSLGRINFTCWTLVPLSTCPSPGPSYLGAPPPCLLSFEGKEKNVGTPIPGQRWGFVCLFRWLGGYNQESRLHTNSYREIPPSIVSCMGCPAPNFLQDPN